MILIREVQSKDLESIHRISDIPGFFNTPRDPVLLGERLEWSRRSFLRNIPVNEAKYYFVAEDISTGKILATSMIAGKHGTAESPHFYFQVGKEQKYSKTINTGFIHGTLQLCQEKNGPSEIGGIVVDPDFRNAEERIGRQISFVRFLFLGLNRDLFQDKIIAELLPPLNRRGKSPLWEAIGRRFTNMDYWEADELCAKNKEFVTSLFPNEKIYTTFLSAEAREAIGKVGKATEPAFKMLSKIGFEYKDQVDPFDGGPHLWVDVPQLKPIQGIVSGEYQGEPKSQDYLRGLLTKVKAEPGEFRAVSVPVAVSETAQKNSSELSVHSEFKYRAEKALDLEPGDQVRFMPFY